MVHGSTVEPVKSDPDRAGEGWETSFVLWYIKSSYINILFCGLDRIGFHSMLVDLKALYCIVPRRIRVRPGMAWRFLQARLSVPEFYPLP